MLSRLPAKRLLSIIQFAVGASFRDDDPHRQILLNIEFDTRSLRQFI